MTTKSLFNMFAVLICASLMATSMSGCHKKRKPLETGTTVPAANNGGGVNGGGLPTPIGDFTPSEKLNATGKIYFDFDKSDIRTDQVPALQADASYIKTLQAPKQVRVEGNCDERGTQEYNVALGERRANAVRDYLIKLGCDGSRLVTLSYGEEKPAVAGHSEAAWSKNRRDEFSESK